MIIQYWEEEVTAQIRMDKIQVEGGYALKKKGKKKTWKNMESRTLLFICSFLLGYL